MNQFDKCTSIAVVFVSTTFVQFRHLSRSGDKKMKGLLEGNERSNRLLSSEYSQIKEFNDGDGWEEVRDRMASD